MRTCARPVAAPADRLVDGVTDVLLRRFPERDATIVRQAVTTAHASLADTARYDQYLGILVTRRATERLRSASA